MAQTKKPIKTVKKVSLKPEVILVARKKTVTKKTKSPQKKIVRRSKKKHTSVVKLAKIRIKKPVFYTIVSVVLAVVTVITWMQVSQSVRETNATLDASKKTANTAYLIAKKEADLIKIIGTRLQRQSEIVNYQSAPKDLQSFVTSDYRTFKQQCIANGKLSSDIGYTIDSVIYDSYAVVKRTCNGTDTAILKKFGEKWAIAFSGNILPPCTIVNDFEIPQGASYFCTQNGISYINPNP